MNVICLVTVVKGKIRRKPGPALTANRKAGIQRKYHNMWVTELFEDIH